jgi:hypothetical protein
MKKSEAENKPATSLLTSSGVLEHLAIWEKIREVRDMWGTRQDSEVLLAILAETGNFTDREALTQLLNTKEKEASDKFREWRRALIYDEDGKEPDGLRRDSSAELIEIYEAYRAIKKTEDEQLLKIWFREQSYPVQFLIANLLANFLAASA